VIPAMIARNSKPVTTFWTGVEISPGYQISDIRRSVFMMLVCKKVPIQHREDITKQTLRRVKGKAFPGQALTVREV
jgi:hypothetical protein